MKKTWVLYSRLSHRLALVNLYLKISNQLAHVMRYYIQVHNTQSIYIYCICKGGDCDIKSPTWTFRLRCLPDTCKFYQNLTMKTNVS